jgi:hypothetical protein
MKKHRRKSGRQERDDESLHIPLHSVYEESKRKVTQRIPSSEGVLRVPCAITPTMLALTEKK